MINSSCAEPGFFATRNSDVAPAAKSLIVFLTQLEDYGEFVSDVTTVRRRTARAKCREVAKQLQPGRAVNAATVCRESESVTDDDASLFGGRIARHATTDSSRHSHLSLERNISKEAFDSKTQQKTLLMAARPLQRVCKSVAEPLSVQEFLVTA